MFYGSNFICVCVFLFFFLFQVLTNQIFIVSFTFSPLAGNYFGYNAVKKTIAWLSCKRIITRTYSSSIDFRGNHCSCYRRSTEVIVLYPDFYCGGIITTSEGRKTQQRRNGKVWRRMLTFSITRSHSNLHTFISLEGAAVATWEL